MVERQITHRAVNHVLTNVAVWSWDSQWIYYDIRSDAAGSQFDGPRIERVQVFSGEVQVIYEARYKACVGVVTASPIEDKIVFIQGPEHPTADWQYSAFHRQGMLVVPGDGQSATTLDARDIVSPFTRGALRGGSHVHTFSGDGHWISFSYEDHVLATDPRPGRQANQRNIGIAVPCGPVIVPKTHDRNHDGAYFSVLVSVTHDFPRPGSDEINRAYEDAWVGTHGYVRADGTRQVRALAFIGDVLTTSGQYVSELFIVDLPENVELAGDGPICGTSTTRPVPPKGTVQRRLTHTTPHRFPGLAPVRHWPRSSPSGDTIACLMRDDQGVVQLWLISPSGANLQQLTHSIDSITSAFTFRGDGRAIACIIRGRVCEVDALTGEIHWLTVSSNHRPRGEAVVYSPDGNHVAFVRTTLIDGQGYNQIFIVESIVSGSG